MMRRILVLLVDGYRRFVSPALPSACRYQPTCSHYAREALLRHGAIKGSLLSAWRILRCNPFTKPGYDPVPPPGKWRAPKEAAS